MLVSTPVKQQCLEQWYSKHYTFKFQAETAYSATKKFAGMLQSICSAANDKSKRRFIPSCWKKIGRDGTPNLSQNVPWTEPRPLNPFFINCESVCAVRGELWNCFEPGCPYYWTTHTPHSLHMLHCREKRLLSSREETLQLDATITPYHSKALLSFIP